MPNGSLVSIEVASSSGKCRFARHRGAAMNDDEWRSDDWRELCAAHPECRNLDPNDIARELPGFAEGLRSWVHRRKRPVGIAVQDDDEPETQAAYRLRTGKV